MLVRAGSWGPRPLATPGCSAPDAEEGHPYPLWLVHYNNIEIYSMKNR